MEQTKQQSNKSSDETKQRQHQRRQSIEHTGVGFYTIVGDFVCQFIPIQIKIVLQKVQFPPKKFKIKSFDDPRKTFENKKVLPVLLERGRFPLHDYRHCTFIF